MKDPNTQGDELKKQLKQLLDKSPINEEVPDDIWGTIYPTWTGLWTDGYGSWDEKQPSDIYPLSELMSNEAKERFINEVADLVASREKAIKMQAIEDTLNALMEADAFDEKFTLKELKRIFRAELTQQKGVE